MESHGCEVPQRCACNEQVQKGKGLQVVTISGASTIGMVCSAFCYLLLMTMHDLEDPNNANYIADPMAVCFLCFLLCGPCIGYGFTMLVDHTFDTVLYCYAFNKRYYKNSGGSPVDDFLPDSMKDVVNIDKEDDDIPYGNARPNMYLNTFMPSGWFPSKKDSARSTASIAAAASPPSSSSAACSAADSDAYAIASFLSHFKMTVGSGEESLAAILIFLSPASNSALSIESPLIMKPCSSSIAFFISASVGSNSSLSSDSSSDHSFS